MSEAERRQALGEFLRTRRARLTPQEVGLTGSARRRTPGLRREEVALLANIGISWYVALEQGRDVHPSEAVLDGIAHALKLTATERQHFLVLAGYPSAVASAEDEAVNPALEQAVMALDPHPAFVLGRRLDVLAWNRAAKAVLNYRQATDTLPQNYLWSYFTDPLAKEIYPDWETSAQLMVAHLRTESARFPGDVWFGEMIAALQEASEYFRQCWSRYDIDSVSELDGRKAMNHPTLGVLEFDSVTLLVPGQTGMKMVFYMSSPETMSKLSLHLFPYERPVT